MKVDFSKLTSSEAHKIVAAWVLKDPRNIPFREELAIRDVLVEFAENGRKNPEGFAGFISERFPRFFSEAVL